MHPPPNSTERIICSDILGLQHCGTERRRAIMGSNERRLACVTRPCILNRFTVSSPVYVYRSHNTLEAFNRKQVTTAGTCCVTLAGCVFVCVTEG